jgi:hypothetical protein
MREEEAAWRAAAERLHRQQEEYLQMLEREAALSDHLIVEDREVGRDQKQQTAAEAQQGAAVSMLKVQTRERELSAGVMELQLSLQDSLNLSAAASWRHTLELQLLATELGALEERLHGAACPHATSSVGAPPPRPVTPPPPPVTQQSVELLRRRAEASEQEAARLHVALQQQI